MIRRSLLSTVNAFVENQNHQTLPTSTGFFSFMCTLTVCILHSHGCAMVRMTRRIQYPMFRRSGSIETIWSRRQHILLCYFLYTMLRWIWKASIIDAQTSDKV